MRVLRRQGSGLRTSSCKTASNVMVINFGGYNGGKVGAFAFDDKLGMWSGTGTSSCVMNYAIYGILYEIDGE
jgi:uncharacterized membrane protein YuzA (DUF378 family)